MSELLAYLQTKHTDIANLVVDFSVQYGVTVKQEDDLFLFKYGIIDTDWKEPIPHECRGSILRHTKETWEFVSRPFDKFFNLHEGPCPIFTDKAFEEVIGSCSVVEKSDGSLIQVWWDDQLNKWRASTSGKITPVLVSEENYTFDDLFWKTANISESFLNKILSKEHTHMFELCCDANRIVTKYDKDHATYLTSRNKQTGEYKKFVFCAEETQHKKKSIIFSTDSIKTKQDLIDFAESQTNNKALGEYPEGFVIYGPKGNPLGKLKNSAYVALHHVGGGDIAASKNKIVDAIFEGHLDDIWGVLSDRLQLFANGVLDKIAAMRKSCAKKHGQLASQKFSSVKAFAITVTQLPESGLRPFFFERKQDYVDGKVDIDINEKFDKWIKERYKKFEWKE